LVLATTSPIHLVGPLAERLGFDEVLATRWVSKDGRYTGTIDGPFVWGREKLRAAEQWAKANDIDLRASYAYSDSYFDGPLLAAVGNPVAVNPDAQLTVLARLRGWPIRHLDVSPGVAKVAGRELQDWLRPLNRPELVPNARFEFSGEEHIPKTGPAILVFNHRSYFDSSAVNLLIARSGRCARFLGKKEVFDVPVVGALSRAFGGIRVVRASGSDEPLEAAADALAGGELVSMAPQGTIPRGPAFFDPELKGRWGAARLAAMTGAPVIPVGLWGTEVVWPRNSRLPRIGVDRPLIQVKVGPPVALDRLDPDEDTRAIMAAIVDLLPPEAREHHTPTAEELARTYPPGYRGDAAKEAERRPGIDTVQEREKADV
jgi:putative phosphoserine phosphatase/1-acylglycerol-3-phosphate O-acyltransferase